MVPMNLPQFSPVRQAIIFLLTRHHYNRTYWQTSLINLSFKLLYYNYGFTAFRCFYSFANSSFFGPSVPRKVLFAIIYVYFRLVQCEKSIWFREGPMRVKEKICTKYKDFYLLFNHLKGLLWEAHIQTHFLLLENQSVFVFCCFRSGSHNLPFRTLFGYRWFFMIIIHREQMTLRCASTQTHIPSLSLGWFKTVYHRIENRLQFRLLHVIQ